MVSRETPSVPAVAHEIFGERLPLAEAYAEWLAGEGTVRGLVGPREVPRLWDRHLLNCAVLAELCPAGATVCDVGSGAGLPGLVLAVARPDLEVTLLEPLLRRTTFLDEVVAALGLENVRVVRGRAEALHGSERFDVVTSRAVAPLDRLLGWSMPLVAAPDGALVAIKGERAEAEILDASSVLRDLGATSPEVLVLGEGRVPSPARAVRVAWAAGRGVGWPLAPARAEPRSSRSRSVGSRGRRRRP